MSNKKAQVATNLLVVVALVLSIFALFTFVSFSDKLTSNSKETTEIAEKVEFSYQYILAQTKLVAKETIQNCQNCDSSQLKEKFKESAKWREDRIFSADFGNFYGQIRNDKFEINKLESSGYKIKIDELFLQAQTLDGLNKIKRNFEICDEFDKKGNFVNECKS